MSFKRFTGWEYLLIDAGIHVGLDKKLFEERIEWATQNLEQLEDFIDEADDKERYTKAVMAIRKAQAGKPMGHRVGLDASSSGIQVMSALTGCYAGAQASGLVDPDRRANAYQDVTDELNRLLGEIGSSMVVSNADAKAAVMTVLYGSRAEPKRVFGEDTEELAMFYQAVQTVAPGAFKLLQELLSAWQPFAPKHSWIMPDGFHVEKKVWDKQEARIEVDELDHSTFSYEWYENTGQEQGLSLAADVAHATDSYLLRSVLRRCNYDVEQTKNAHSSVANELWLRGTGEVVQETKDIPEVIQYYMERYEATNVADVVIIPYLNIDDVGFLSDSHLEKLSKILTDMLSHKSFPVLCIHDESI